MASRSLGTLTLDLVARIGGFEQGLDKAEREAKKRAAAIEKAFEGAFTAVTAGFALLASAGAAALTAMNRQAESIANFQTLADKVGDTAEQVATLQKATVLSGVAMDSVAEASIKLTTSLAKTDDESKAVGVALKDIGLSFNEFKRLSPVEQIESVAKAFDRFEDGAGKTAVAVSLFGKSGAALIPFLKDLAAEGERQVGLTGGQIKAAKEYTDAQARLRAEFQAFTQQQTAQYIPTMNQVLGILSDIAKNEAIVEVTTAAVSIAVKAAVVVLQTLLVVGSEIVFVFKMVGQEIGGVAAQLGALARLDVKGFTAISDMMKEDAALARRELDAFQARVMRIGRSDYMDDETRRLMARSAANRPGRPVLNATAPPSAGGAKDDPTKRLLDNELRVLERYISDQQDLLRERNKFLDLYNQQGLLSISDYFTQQQNVLDEATQNQIKAYDAQIKALRAYQASAAKATDRAEAEGRINDLLDKQEKLQRDAGSAAIEAGIKRDLADRAYQNTLKELNAQLLELQGNLGAAAAIRFDLQNEGLRRTLEVMGNIAGQEQLSRIRQLTVAQADLNKLQSDYALAQGFLSVQEDRIALDRQMGTKGEIEGLLALGKARRDTYEQLKGIAEQYRVIAILNQDPNMLLAAERMNLAVKQLGASLDPLADKINTLFADSFADAFGSILDGTKSAKEAFRDLANSILKELARLAVQDTFKRLFSSSGLSGSGSGGFDLGGLISGLFGGARANGGPVLPNTLYRVNERGPEMFEAANGAQFLMTGTQGGNVIPNGSMGGGVNNFYVTVPQQTSRATGAQIAAEAARKLEQGRRNL